jgi:cell division protein FtsI (penicillin-binding protein 3)
LFIPQSIRMMKRNPRIGMVHAALALLALGVLAKAAHVQIVQGSAWTKLARRQHFAAKEVPAPRGPILDASGRTLATTREAVRLQIAPREVRTADIGRLRRLLAKAGVSAAAVQRLTDARREWGTVPGSFVAEDVAAIIAIRGVYTTPLSERAYAMSGGLRGLVGRVSSDGRALDGLELSLDSLLRGSNGHAQLVRDVRGRNFISPTRPGQAPRPGHTIVLTINQELQEIAERTLADAIARMNADGGDIVILDPRSGQILAMAGERRDVRSPGATAITEPFEPGSTLKPLIAAALLTRGKARTTDVVSTKGGTYVLHGRTIHDEPHPGPTPSQLTLAEVIRYSSNVGIVQFAQRLTPREEFEALRDFGLGSPTGIQYSPEAAGTLRPPRAWSRQTPASLAMGYEVSVTPLQLALAYAALANGGDLLEPVLVKEVRTREGEIVFRSRRRVVRRVVSEKVAATVRTLLTDVVERGTAVDADLAAYALAGKTGTPRRTVGGQYAPRQYNPNFVGLFPADAPQLVVVVKMSSPRGSFHGGQTAAPMTKTILQAAIAARDAALDRSQLAAAVARTASAVQAERPLAQVATLQGTTAKPQPADTTRRVVLHLPPAAARNAAVPANRSVPDVRGLRLRDAVRSLHDAGFRVQLTRGAYSASLTEPAPGALVPPGSLVRLRYSR